MHIDKYILGCTWCYSSVKQQFRIRSNNDKLKRHHLEECVEDFTLEKLKESNNKRKTQEFITVTQNSSLANYNLQEHYLKTFVPHMLFFSTLKIEKTKGWFQK